MNEHAATNETPDSEYKDDPAEFAQSSDLANRGAADEYAGGGADDSSEKAPRPKGEQRWQSGRS